MALPQSPEARRPDHDPKAALDGRNLVLDRMVSEGIITPDEAAAAKSEPIPTARRDFPMLAAHLADEAASRRTPMRGRSTLTVDKRLQGALEKLAVRSRRRRSARRCRSRSSPPTSRPATSSPRSARPATSTPTNGGFVDMTTAVRSPGSTLKPLIYGLAFELGLAHPQSLIEDRPTAFHGYVPVNFDGLNRGTVTIHDALTESLNVPAVIVLDAVGVARLVSRLKRANANPVLPDETAAGLAVGLGGVGITLRDLVSVYAAIARGGTEVHLNDGVTPPIGRCRPDRAGARSGRRLVRHRHPPRRAAAAQRLAGPHRLQDRHVLRLSRRLVDRVRRQDGDRRLGRPARRRAGARACRHHRRGADPVRSVRPPRARRQPAFKPAPPGVLFASNAELPEPLKRFRHPDDDRWSPRKHAPEIAFPADGVDVDLGAASGADLPLTIKVRNGVPPFTFFANGAPFGHSDFARQDNWTPDGPGYVTLSVVDAKGRSDAVKVFIE